MDVWLQICLIFIASLVRTESVSLKVLNEAPFFFYHKCQVSSPFSETLPIYPTTIIIQEFSILVLNLTHYKFTQLLEPGFHKSVFLCILKKMCIAFSIFYLHKTEIRQHHFPRSFRHYRVIH